MLTTLPRLKRCSDHNVPHRNAHCMGGSCQLIFKDETFIYISHQMYQSVCSAPPNVQRAMVKRLHQFSRLVLQTTWHPSCAPSRLCSHSIHSFLIAASLSSGILAHPKVAQLSRPSKPVSWLTTLKKSRVSFQPKRTSLVPLQPSHGRFKSGA